MKLGIDFGTTRTVVAACDRGNYPLLGFESAEGESLDWYPSVVALDGERRVYGLDGLYLLQQGAPGLRSFKRLLSDPAVSAERLVTLGGQQLPLQQLLVEFLRSLRHDLIHRSNSPITPADDEPLEAMIAVPANSSSTQRFLTLEAFRAAGFLVQGLLNEPSAASVEYAHRFKKSVGRGRERVLVYDLGGGTFDASLVDLGDGSHRVIASVGRSDLGGDDFDRLLLSLALDQAGRAHPSGPAEVALLDQCRVLKESLHPNTRKLTVDLDEETAIAVRAADLYQAAAPLLQRTLDAIADVLPPGDPAQSERFDTSALAGVYVVGGASDLPAVARTLREVFGRRVRRSAYSSGATAVGLAIALDQGIAIEERFSRTFGVFRELSHGQQVRFDPILSPDLPLDAAGTLLIRRYQARHNIGHFRFAEADAVQDHVPVGRLVPFGELRFPFDRALQAAGDLADVQVQRTDAGPQVEERYTVDPQGRVQVRITDLDSGYAMEHRLG